MIDRGKALCEELKAAGIHHLVWLPCSATRFMQEAILSDPGIKVIRVCREGEAVGVCVGLHLGGKRAALVVESAGMFDSGNVLNWAVGLEIPMLLLVGYTVPYPSLSFFPASQRLLTKDYSDAFLTFFGVKCYSLDNDEEVKNVSPACEEAWRTNRPVALLVNRVAGSVVGA
ncbi:MAG: thiamine pyrophosphate-binding protein [Dehalococcoidia bacterium]|nr:thiamine pyrophosphate-binding protein [Dehalococcoidia bacterium]